MRPWLIPVMLAGALCAAEPSAAQSDACQIQHLDAPISGTGLGRIGFSGERLASASKASEVLPWWGVGIFERVDITWTHVTTVVPNPPVTTFGRSVGIDGDRLIAGAPLAPGIPGGYGAVYFFERSSCGAWVQVAKLTPSDLGEYDEFGGSVAISGDIAAVAAPYHNKPFGSGGAVYVYERDTSGVWSQKAKLKPTKGGGKMGTSLACHGNIIVAGAPFDSTLGFGAGAAYVFERDPGGNWVEKGKLYGDDSKPLDNFGFSVGVGGDRLLVGSPQAKSGIYWTGAVYAFSRGPTGSWSQSAKVLAPDALEGDGFGYSVALDDQLALVGAPGVKDKGLVSGAAYVLYRSAAEWVSTGKLVPVDLQPQDHFGDDVAISGHIACVRTWPQDAQNPKPASVYIFAVGPDLNNNGLMDPCECPGDLNKDWIVDQADLGLLLQDWGCTGGLGYDPSNKPCPAAQTGCCGDLDADGDVDQADLGILLQNYGKICP